MTDLAGRVLAAIDDAERNVHYCGKAKIGWGTYLHPDGSMRYTSAVARNGDIWVADGHETTPSIVRVVFDPPAELNRCAADRRTVERHQPEDVVDPCGCGRTHRYQRCVGCEEEWPCPDLLDRADAYGVEVNDER